MFVIVTLSCIARRTIPSLHFARFLHCTSRLSGRTFFFRVFVALLLHFDPLTSFAQHYFCTFPFSTTHCTHLSTAIPVRLHLRPDAHVTNWSRQRSPPHLASLAATPTKLPKLMRPNTYHWAPPRDRGHKWSGGRNPGGSVSGVIHRLTDHWVAIQPGCGKVCRCK